MASSFEKQLLASQTFLNGVRALPSFEDQRTKQFQHICLKIGKIKLKTEQIAKIFAIFEEGLWGPHADELKSALANSNEVDVVMPRKKNQDFLFLVNYIPKTIWESLERDDLHGGFGEIMRPCYQAWPAASFGDDPRVAACMCFRSRRIHAGDTTLAYH